MIGKLRHLKNPRQVADDLLNRFGLTHAANRRVSTYSGGMRRRLDLAMSLVGKPLLIFLDEPTTGLDPEARIEVWKIVKELAVGGTTVFLTTNRSPFRTVLLSSHLFSLKMYIQIILENKEHLSDLENQLDTLVEQIEECQIIQSIPGIGDTIAATIIAEIGEIERFNHAKKLVAFAGVDPSVHSSGKFTATINRITKRGSSRLRHALYLAVLCSLRKTGSKRLQTFYKAKREDGKAHKVALVACINKLLHWIYAVLKRNETFLDLA